MKHIGCVKIGMFQNQGEDQIKEIINASVFSVFLSTEINVLPLVMPEQSIKYDTLVKNKTL